MKDNNKNPKTCQTIVFSVYVIWCYKTNMHYVGITHRRVETRICEHKRGKGQFVDNKIQSVGWESNWDWWIVEEHVPSEQISEREQYWVAFFDCVYPKGYNKTIGGIKHFKHSEETREKMRGKHHTKEAKAKMSKKRLGKKHTDETKERMRQAHLGKKHTEKAKEKVRQVRLGKHPTEEARANMRKAHLGKKHTEEEKAKIGKAHLGKKRNEETKAKMREKALAREARKRAAKAVAEENLAAANSPPTSLSTLLDAVILQ